MAVRVGRRAIPPLIEKLGDPDKGVRGAAANALMQLGDRRAIEPLFVERDFGIELDRHANRVRQHDPANASDRREFRPRRHRRRRKLRPYASASGS